MQKSITIILAFSMLIALVLSCACALQPTASEPLANQTSQNNVGFARITGSTDSTHISFDIARQNLMTYVPDSTNKSALVKTIYFIHGTDVNESGDAASWIFGVRMSNVTELLAYDSGSWIKIPWNNPFDSEEIDLEKIVSPSLLFSKNNALIINTPPVTNPERRDIDLKKGIYTLTINSNNTVRILTFNATTGELIASND